MQKGAVSADKSTEVDEAVEKEEGILAFLLNVCPLQACSHTCFGWKLGVLRRVLMPVWSRVYRILPGPSGAHNL